MKKKKLTTNANRVYSRTSDKGRGDLLTGAVGAFSAKSFDPCQAILLFVIEEQKVFCLLN
jgi:NAD(P)H-hydrate repair Nnr-like enzyme with NAD(P)H-hydrate dehydratase domain